jgi:thymidylate synthase ThyX
VGEDEWYLQHGELDPSPSQKQRLSWDSAQKRIQRAYRYLVDSGMPAEDARGLLPTNIKTRINMVTDLRALIGLAGVRLCTQAQFEWRSVFTQIAAAIHDYNPYADLLRQAENLGEVFAEDLVNHVAGSERWQYEAIAKTFRPICYMTGKCEFKATADRSCTIRNRVDANAALGRPSSEWHKDLLEPPEDGPFLGRADNIQAIDPVEWMLDPTAAR